MKYAFSACVIALFFVGCDSSAPLTELPASTSPAGEPLSVSFAAIPSSAPVKLTIGLSGRKSFAWGEIIDTSFTLTNTSAAAVVVTQLEDRGLSKAKYGSLGKTAKGYAHNEWRQMSCGTFHTGFLLPGESAEFTFPFRPDDPQMGIRLQYRIADQPYDKTPASLAPFDVYINEPSDEGSRFAREYIPFTVEGWKKVVETPGQISVSDGRIHRDGPPHREVIIPGWDSLRKEEASVMLTVPVDIGGAIFSRTEAARSAKRISGSDSPLAYSSALGGWVVFEADHTWLLSTAGQTSVGKALPLVHESLFFDVDKDKTIRVQVARVQPAMPATPDTRLTGEKIWNRYPIEWGDGMYTRGQFINVTASELGGFLANVAEKQLSLERHDYFFTSHYFVLKDAKERQAVGVGER